MSFASLRMNQVGTLNPLTQLHPERAERHFGAAPQCATLED
jgi:hypothetical protein